MGCSPSHTLPLETKLYYLKRSICECTHWEFVSEVTILKMYKLQGGTPHEKSVDLHASHIAVAHRLQ